MKIAIINPWAISNKAIGGTERFVIDLAESLVKINNKVDVFMFSGSSHVENGVNYVNINLFNMIGEADEYIVQNKFGKLEDEDAYIKLAKELERKIDVSNYDFIQLNSLLFLEAWKDKKRIFTIHTNPFEYKLAWGENSYYKMLEIMKKYKNDKLTYFVTPSIFYKREYNKISECDIKYIPHAIDINRLHTNISKLEIINKYELDNEKIKIIIPSRLEPIQKQPMMVIEACSLLEKDIKDKIQIIFTGLDKQYEKFVDELKDNAKRNELNIKIIKFDNMSEAYKIADITVLPSKSESFGYSALESLSLGIPTILNNIPTFKEIAKGVQYCKIFDNTPEGLKKKLVRILKNSKYIKRNVPSKDWVKKYEIKEFTNSYLKIIN